VFKNLVDSEVMLGLLQGAGYRITTDAADADAIIVNTCGFLARLSKRAWARCRTWRNIK
jgi:ribosomal protein S12 methylthiotransferase